MKPDFFKLLFVFSLMFSMFIIQSCKSKSTNRSTNIDTKSVQTNLQLQSMNPQPFIDVLLSPNNNATITNITMAGDARCLSTFSQGDLGGNPGFDSGIILSSGAALGVVGPNISDETSNEFFTQGDIFLSGLIGNEETFDACVLEFDFECEGADSVGINYVLASEEYNEYVSEANDVFGFGLNGNNIATIPNSGGLPVAITNLNCGNPYNPLSPTTPSAPFCDLFINNDLQDGGPFINLEADGLTNVLRAEASLVNGVNHMKFAVADVLDAAFDTWIFIEAGSFQCNVPTPEENDLFLITTNCPVEHEFQTFDSEDIFIYDSETNSSQLYFDGSDVCMGPANIDAFAILPSGDILMSFSGKVKVGGLGRIKDEDIIRFIPESLGEDTAGRFVMFFDGSEHGITNHGNDIDGFDLVIEEVTGSDADNDGIPNEEDACPLDPNNDIDDDGICADYQLYLSLGLDVEIDGNIYADEDIIIFDEASESYTLFFDGSDVGLADIDIDAVKILDNQEILFVIDGSINLANFGQVDYGDVLRFTPDSLGENTSGTFSFYLEAGNTDLTSHEPIAFNGFGLTKELPENEE